MTWLILITAREDHGYTMIHPVHSPKVFPSWPVMASYGLTALTISVPVVPVVPGQELQELQRAEDLVGRIQGTFDRPGACLGFGRLVETSL
jgi:hypothetical protein